MAIDPSFIVQVTVSLQSAAIDRAGFGTPLGVFQIDPLIQANRFQLYSTVQELIDAGFGATDNAVQWATVVKSQDPSPARFALGRRVEGTAQVDTVTISGADAGTWSVTIDTVVFSFIAGASDTTQTIAEGLKAAIDAGSVPVNTSVPVAGVFTVTANVAGETFVNGGIVIGGGGAGTFVNTTPSVPAEAMATTLTAINTENSVDWYFLNIETRNDADISAVQAFITALPKRAFCQSSDPDALTSTPGNIFETIQLLNDSRMTMVWHDDDSEYLDGGITAIAAAADLDAEGGVITLHGKQVTGVPTDDLTTAEILSVAGDNISADGFGGNVHTRIAGRGFFMFGKSSDGEFFDVGTTTDWTQFRVTEDVFQLIATIPTKIAYTNDGIAAISGAVLGRLRIGVTNGHFSNDDPQLPRVTAPLSTEVSTADKTGRILRNVVGFAQLSGAIHSAVIQVNVAV